MNSKSIRSVGIILDGNRRFAKAKNLPSLDGHRAGYEALKKIAVAAPRLKKEYGLEYVTLYAFSTENWNRQVEEVSYLMDLFAEALTFVINTFVRDGAKDPVNAIRVKIVGQRERFSPKLQKLMTEVEEKTAAFGGLTAVFALSYGGRAEIAAAAEKLRTSNEPVTEEIFTKALWSGQAGVPDPEIVIRTGGEKRLSNFLPWQSTYAELFFPETLWPDFTVSGLEKIFQEYYSREKRHGA